MTKRLLFHLFFTATITLIIGSASAQCTLSVTDIVESSAISCNGSCDGELVVTFSGEIGTASFQWFDASNIDLGINNDTVTAICAGTYTVFITDNNNCTVDTIITLSDPAVITSTITRVNTVCATFAGELSITGGGGCGAPYTYFIDGVALLGSDSAGLAVGFYTITVQDNCGCSQEFTEYVSSTNGPSFTTSFINPLCNGANNGTITIIDTIGTGPITQSIDGGGSFSANLVYNNLPPNGYQVIVQDGTGCQSLAYLNLIEPDAISVTPILIDETCVLNNGSIDFQSSGGTGAYAYSIDNGASFQAGSSFTGLTGGVYVYVIEDDNACQIFGQAVLFSEAGPTITNSSFLNPVCSNNCNGTISITAFGNSPISYSLDGGVTSQVTGEFIDLCIGNYTIDITNIEGCLTSQNLVLTAPEPPIAGFTVSDDAGPPPLTVTFTNTSIGATSSFWDFGSSSATSLAMDETFEYITEGFYTVMMVATELLCSDTAYQVISVTGTPDISMPNVFTPNNDGINDVLRPFAIGMNEIIGKIYNRWGELIYEWQGINGYWDGYTRPAGQIAPAGTYFYVVTATDVADVPYALSGTVQLMR
jgi:gliding motility-associated-like protein